jgi:trans-AT polyketide synthase, acyltransferase and oxidoreductase domains
MTRLETDISKEYGWWQPSNDSDLFNIRMLSEKLLYVNQPIIIVQTNTGPALADSSGERIFSGYCDAPNTWYPVIAAASSCPINLLGDVSFCRDWNIQYPVLSGSMANGISSVELLSALSGAGMTGFYGAAGQDIETVESAIVTLSSRCGGGSWGVNLIHSPHEPVMEEHLVDLLIRRNVTQIEASAYLTITRALVRYRLHGLHRDSAGRIVAPNRILAKASRVEIANRFFSPPPEKIVRELVSDGTLNEDTAALASYIPLAGDITAEADSGGHTDNRPLVALLPSFQAVARDCMTKYRYPTPLRVGAAGGISTPAAVAAAFAMGAGWVMTGSISQAATESGSSDVVRGMLAEVQQAETVMAPAADMFEMGVNLQVLKRGTLFPMRARKLYELYREYESLDAIPPKERMQLEKTVFRASLDTIWNDTRQFWSQRDPSQVTRADKDAKHKMALVFRWYLGLSSRWANAGHPDRKADYQVWCGPAMGAFNQWTRGSFLENRETRQINTMLLNILWGAAVLLRCRNLQTRAFEVPQHLFNITPAEPETILKYIS